LQAFYKRKDENGFKPMSLRASLKPDRNHEGLKKHTNLRAHPSKNEFFPNKSDTAAVLTSIITRTPLGPKIQAFLETESRIAIFIAT